jgi:hypothetical protein
MGWISVASIVNVSTALTPTNGVGDLGWEPGKWAVVMMCVATGLGVLMLALHKDAAYAATLAWALIAIGKQQAEPSPFPGGNLAANAATALGAILAALSGLMVALRVYWWWCGKTPAFAPPGAEGEAEGSSRGTGSGSGDFAKLAGGMDGGGSGSGSASGTTPAFMGHLAASGATDWGNTGGTARPV